MDVLELMKAEEEATLAEAVRAVAWLEHYERDGEDLARARLGALYRLVEDAVRTRDLQALVAHAGRIASERHAAGYRRVEVLSAFAALEEAIWHRVLLSVPAEERTWAEGLVGTALAQAREALEEAFAGLARSPQAGFVDLSPLFRGARVRGTDRPGEDMVHPV
jgi:hypothetical protein